MSFAKAVKTDNISSPTIRSGMRSEILIKKSWKKYPMMNCPKSQIKRATNDQGHNLVRTRSSLPRRCARHQVNGELILFPTRLPMMPITECTLRRQFAGLLEGVRYSFFFLLSLTLLFFRTGGRGPAVRWRTASPLFPINAIDLRPCGIRERRTTN